MEAMEWAARRALRAEEKRGAARREEERESDRVEIYKLRSEVTGLKNDLSECEGQIESLRQEISELREPPGPSGEDRPDDDRR